MKLQRENRLLILKKISGLKIEDIADLNCESYDTTRKNIYNKRLSKRLWIRYYKFFINYIRKLDHPNDYISTGR